VNRLEVTRCVPGFTSMRTAMYRPVQHRCGSSR
jgi:hypothetical protein